MVYPSVAIQKKEVTSVTKNNQLFELITSEKELYQSRNIIISSGLKDVLPDIENISGYYGRSLFNCPYCDGWELRDKPLVVIIDDQFRVFISFRPSIIGPKTLLFAQMASPFKTLSKNV